MTEDLCFFQRDVYIAEVLSLGITISFEATAKVNYNTGKTVSLEEIENIQQVNKNEYSVEEIFAEGERIAKKYSLGDLTQSILIERKI